MGAITTTVKEVEGSGKSTCTVTLSGSNVTLRDATTQIEFPSLRVKYSPVGAKNALKVYAKLIYYMGGLSTYHEYETPNHAGFVKVNANTNYTVPLAPADTWTISTSDVFNRFNRTTRVVPVYVSAYQFLIETGKYIDKDSVDNPWGRYDSSYGDFDFDGTLFNVTLDAPPTFSVSTTTPSPENAEYYEGYGGFEVQISNALAQYGGDIISSSLTVGTATVTGTGNGFLSTPSDTYGEVVPVVKVTDSRGQITSVSLKPITVYRAKIPITILNSRALTKAENNTYNTTRGVRVDMLVDCRLSGTIERVLPTGMKLYNMDGTQITLPYKPPETLVRCYGVVDATTQVPTNVLGITLINPTGQYNYAYVGYPSTGTPTAIRQKSEVDPISPQITIGDVRFNPETSGLNAYAMNTLIGSPITSMTSTQTNVDEDIKHIVTHASNVRIDDTTTLQDWITEQYNNLT